MADGFTEYKMLFKKVEGLERDIQMQQADFERLTEARCPACRADIDRLILMVVGDEDLQLNGIFGRVRAVEITVEELARLIDKYHPGGPRSANLWPALLSGATLLLLVWEIVTR